MIDSEARAVESNLPDLIAGRYKVQRVLGRGGMATVYLCDDLQAPGLVAVKVLRREIGSAVVVERFLREIEFASRLDHARIPRVLDSGTTEDGTPFYVMTYIEGESLRDLLDRVKQLPIDDAVAITSAVMEPMTYAHRMGIVHRDIKPGNIIIGVEGVHVLDFGIARAIVASAEDRLTSTGIAIGTPAYMSPEQALGDHDLDARSDIYTLGCVVYEMIAGIPPFVGATPQAAMARRFAAVAPPLSETRDGVPAHVVAAIAKALNRAPADRWQTVSQFRDALTATVPSASMLAIERQFASKRHLYARTGAAIMTGVVVVILGATWATKSQDFTNRGIDALNAWDFPAAEQHFRAAVDQNPSDPEALLWLGQTLHLRGAPLIDWRPFILQAADLQTALNPVSRGRLGAMKDLAGLESGDRCARLGSMIETGTQNRTSDVSLSLAYADCLSTDSQVLPDSGSDSGFRFRSSHERAAREYEALLLRHSMKESAFRELMPRLERVLVASKNALRGGRMRDQPDAQFVAWSAASGDSMVQVPYRVGGDGAPIPEPDPDSQDKLVARNLERLTVLAQAWTARHAKSSDAHETLSRVLEASGKLDGGGLTALAEIRLAQAHLPVRGEQPANAYHRRIRLAAAEARLLVRLMRFPEARLVAEVAVKDSIVVANQDTAVEAGDYLRAALAALIGQQRRALALELRHGIDYNVRLASGEVQALPHEAAADALRLENFCVFGVPVDSIHAVQSRLSRRLDALVSERRRREVRTAVLRRPLSLATPSIGTHALAQLGVSSDLFSRAVVALASGNVSGARAISDSLATMHAGSAPGEVTMDAVLLDAWLLTAVGDSTGAARRIDDAFEGLSRMPANFFRHTSMPASLVRVMLLRSELPGSIARDWRRRARELWGKGDPDLVALLSEPAA